MKKIKRLIKETFNLWVRKRWFKETKNACDKYIKTKEKIDANKRKIKKKSIDMPMSQI